MLLLLLLNISKRREGVVNDLVEEFRKEFPSVNVTGAISDLSTREGCDSLISQVEAIGTLDVLVNNMGIFNPKDFFEVSL